MKIKTLLIPAILAAALSHASGYRGFDSQARRGLDRDETGVTTFSDGLAERKSPGIFFNRRSHLPPGELMKAAAADYGNGNLAQARKKYDILVRSHPHSMEAPAAQLNLGKILEQQGKYGKAFAQYKYLLDFYPEHAPADEVLSRCLAIALWNFEKGREEKALDFLEEIASTAPAWRRAPEVLSAIGKVQLARRKYFEAAEAFDSVETDFPASPQALEAAALHAEALFRLSRIHKEDMGILSRAVSVTLAALRKGAGAPWRDGLSANLKELIARRDLHAYETAKFYDTKKYGAKTAIAAYGDFLKRYPLSVHAEAARARIKELSEGTNGENQ